MQRIPLLKREKTKRVKLYRSLASYLRCVAQEEQDRREYEKWLDWLEEIGELEPDPEGDEVQMLLDAENGCLPRSVLNG